MAELLPSSSIIMVGIIPTAHDLEIARVLGWYRIPLKTAPKVINVEYIAFYQTGTFGQAHRWRIESFAEVKGHELTTRSELLKDQPDHPRANEEYYKLQLGPLRLLPAPILSDGWKRITFFYTTGELLTSALTIKDLVVRTEERQLLWRSLRERALKSGEYHAQEFPDLPDDPLLLALLGIFSG